MKPHEMYLAYFYYGTVAIITLIVIAAGIHLIRGLIKHRKNKRGGNNGMDKC